MLLTPTQIELATALRDSGMAWDMVAVKLRTSEFKLRCMLDPGYRERRRSDSQKAQKRMQQRREALAKEKGEPRCYKRLLEHNPHAMFKAEMAPKIVPAEVIAERERAYGDWLSINQAVLGDPPPGRSALDRRRG